MIFAFLAKHNMNTTPSSAYATSIQVWVSLQQKEVPHKPSPNYLYSTIFTTNGMKPDPAKVQALQNLTAPENHKKLQSVLGLINYIHPFLSDLASETTFLREQVCNWDWKQLFTN